MKKANIQKLLQVAILILALSTLVGCGSSKTGSGFGSADSGSTTTDTTPTTAMAACSEDVQGLSDLKVRLMQYSTSTVGSLSSYVHLQLAKAPSEWQSSNLDLLVYRWTAAPDGSTSIDSTPLQYQWERRNGGSFSLLSSNWYQVFNWSEVVQMADYYKASTNVTLDTSSPQAWANATGLVVNLKDSTNSYQVLRLVFKNGGTVARQVDVLIPAFQANPSVYNADSRHPAVLQALHPLKQTLGQTWSDAQYTELARAFCF
jgi:hypothetical protein